jgi:predicted small metal-binding protein
MSTDDLQFHYVLSCPCGATLTGDSEDEIVQASLAHLREQHPEMEDKYDREQILAVAQRLVKPS